MSDKQKLAWVRSQISPEGAAVCLAEMHRATFAGAAPLCVTGQEGRHAMKTAPSIALSARACVLEYE